MPVVDNGRRRGILTDRDIVVRAVAEGHLDRSVRDVVSQDLVTAPPDMSTKQAAELMGRHQGNALQNTSEGVRER